jgi:hypothetical protein
MTIHKFLQNDNFYSYDTYNIKFSYKNIIIAVLKMSNNHLLSIIHNILRILHLRLNANHIDSISKKFRYQEIRLNHIFFRLFVTKFNGL